MSDLTTTFLGDNPAAERIYDNIQATLPSVQLPMIKMQLWNTISEFATRSTYFREEVSWTMPPGIYSVDFNPFDGEMLVAWLLSQRGLFKFRVRAPGELIDCGDASQVRTGTVLLALKPARFDGNLPPILFDTWFETILAGTLARLCAQPAKPYSSPQLASFHASEFRAGINRARDIAIRGNTDRPGRWGFPYFAGGVRKQ